MINRLTKKQEEDIIPHRNFWLNYILSCKNSINKQKAQDAVNWLYSFCGKKPPSFIVMNSPFGCQVAANLFKNKCDNIRANIGANIRANIRDNIWDNIGANIWDNIRDNIGDNIRADIWDNIRANIRDNIWDNIGANIRANIRADIWDNIWANIGANIRANIRDNIWDNIWDNIGANIRADIWDNIRANIRDNIWDNIGANIRANIRDNIRANNISYHTTSYYGNVSDYGWVAFIDYFIKHDLIKTEKKNDFLKFKELLLSGIFDMIQFDGMCIVSDMPTLIKRNESGRLHSTTGFAVQFKDGWGKYYVNGRHIPDNIFKSASNLTKEQFIKETNSDYKGAWYEILGQKKIMDLLGAKLIDEKTIAHKNGDLEDISLWKTDEVFPEIDNQPFAWIKMVCPSTGTQYLQGVEPHHNDALSAIASLSKFSKEEYSFNFRA